MWGVEGETSWARLRVITSTVFILVVFLRSASRISRASGRLILGTIAGRAGMAWDRTLLYGKAGGAYAIDNYEVIDNFLRLQFPFPVLVESTSATGGERRWEWDGGGRCRAGFLR